MHVITKILVVFAAVLSILLAGLSIMFSSNAQRITAQFQDERLAKETALNQLKDEQSASALQVTALEKKADAITGQLGDLRREKEALQLDNGKLLAATKTAEAAAMSVQARIDQLAATSQTQASLIDVMYKEVSKLRENELKYAQREVEYTDRFNDLSAQLEVARETNRALQEQIAEIQTDRSKAGTAITDRSQIRSPGAPIQARVTNVRRDVSGQMLAEIDAGSSDRIFKDMELSIVRGGKDFLGTLKVQSVNLNDAVGLVNTLGKQVEIRPGDTVLTTGR